MNGVDVIIETNFSLNKLLIEVKLRFFENYDSR